MAPNFTLYIAGSILAAITYGLLYAYVISIIGYISPKNRIAIAAAVIAVGTILAFFVGVFLDRFLTIFLYIFFGPRFIGLVSAIPTLIAIGVLALIGVFVTKKAAPQTQYPQTQ